MSVYRQPSPILIFLGILFLSFLSGFPALCRSEDAVNKKSAVQASLVSSTLVTNVKLPSIQELTTAKEALPKDKELDEQTRAALDQHLTKSIESIQGAEFALKKRNELIKELESASTFVAELEKKLANISTTEAHKENTLENMTLDVITPKIKELETLLNTSKQNLQQLSAEIERRNQRRPLLEELKNKTQAQIQEVTQQLTLPVPDGEHQRVTEARMQRNQLRQIRLKEEVELLQQEAKTYEATQRLWTLKHDVAELESRELEKTLQVYQKKATELKKKQAEEEAQAARWQIALSHESVKLVAEKNSLFAEENTKLVSALQKVQAKLDNTNKELKHREDEFAALVDRAKASEYSPAIGVLLRNQKVSLPDRDDIQHRIQEKQGEIAALNVNLTEWQIERKSIIDIRAATESIIDKLESLPDSVSKEDLAYQVQELLTARLRLLGDMQESGSKLLDLLVTVDSKEKQLLKQVDRESEWLASQVLWVRSTSFMGTQSKTFVTSIKSLSKSLKWGTILATIYDDIMRHYIWWTLTLLAAILITVSHRKIRDHIRQQGELARKARCISIQPTLEAFLATVLLSATLPLLAWCLGWRLKTIGSGDNMMIAFGSALQLTSIVWGAFEYLRHVTLHYGLGTAHFLWSAHAMSSLHRHLRIMNVTLLPMLFMLFFLEYLNDEDVLSSIGRVLFLISLVITVIYIVRLFSPRSTIIKALETRKNDRFFWKTRWLWMGAIFITPPVLAVLSISGYHYTAIQLSERVAMTLGSAFILVFASSFLARWILTTYRSLSILRSEEKKRLAQAGASLHAVEKNVKQDGIPELGLLDINEQARRLLRWVTTVAFAASIYMIWVDVLPALGFLKEIQLWANANSIEKNEASLSYITALDLLLALLVGSMTFTASRNVPGLLEIAVWQRLPFDAGARYAASTLSRYVIVVAGMIYCCHKIGIGWTSVQWLVAAMTVGLGFGLQEIFANFVSGMILLFERPVRVGDTVTIGDVTGTVSRIQIRATTITDWDNKELIVPNKEFVTGNLVNWTLSNSILRLVIKIGVDYGSDTKLVTRILYQVGRDHHLTMKVPEPYVAFTEFGDSSLNFELRVYVNGLENYRNLKNDLHMKINELFAQYHIEIAYPHHDINIRTLPPEFIHLVKNKLSA